MPGHRAVLAVAPEAGHARVDEARVQAARAVGPQAELLEHAGPEGVDQDVEVGQQRVQQRDALRGLEVDGDGGLAAREQVVGGGGAVGGGGGGAVVGGGVGAVDADDSGAVVGEEEAGEGACGRRG